MSEITIEQALYCRERGEAPRLLARSPGFLDDWLPDAEWLIQGFGEPLPGVACPAAVFGQPLGRQHVVVVQVAQRGGPGVLDYHLLILPRAAYTRFLGDPFAVARQLPPPWSAPDPLPVRTLPKEPPAARTVQEVQQILKRTKAAALSEDVDPNSEAAVEHTIENAQSPALLGGVQVLVDGGRVVFERPAPDPDLMEGLWTLLPASTRAHLWPASFAFGNALRFDALVTPRARGEEYQDYTGEEQAAEYPEGVYERRLQTAAEAGDQAELDALFGRRSVNETIRVALTLVVILSVVVLALKIFDQGPVAEPLSPEQIRLRSAVVISLVGTANPLNTVGMLPAAQAQHAWRVTRPSE
jgi:hypothetical protein